MNIEKNIRSGAAAAFIIAASTSLAGNITIANADNNVNKSGVVNVSALNIRSGAGTNYSKVGTLYKNDKVTIQESKNGWHKVKLSNGEIGWVLGEYISIGTSNSSTNSSSTSNTGTVNVSVLNVRSGAGTKYSKVGVLNKNDKVTIQESKSGWYKVKLSNGKVGWVLGEYISIGTNNSLTSSSSSTSKTGTVNVSVLNVRSGAGTNYSKVGVLNKNDKVTIQESKSGWYKVKLSNGKVGWVSAEYISIGTSNSSTSSSASASKTGTVNVSALNVRSEAGTNYSKVGILNKNDKVTIQESKNGWHKVKLSNGKVGWVSAEYISIGTSNSGSINNNTSNKAAKAVELAKKQLGKPYGWGAEGPNSFDCSGLTYYVYKQNGITLPRSSKSQASAGKSVSKSNLKAGDLVFFNTNGKGISHVGIYIGDGKMIHSTKPGDVVKTTSINSSYYANKFVTARRIVN